MTDAEGDAAEGGDDEATVPPRARTTLLVVGLVTVAAGIPLAVALGVLASPRWYPLLDLAQTELRVRDVGTADSPLVGLAGRINGDDGLQGSHPGPLSFWALAPFYTLLGRSAWALQGAAVALNLLAIGAAVAIAHRRGGRWAAVGTALALAVLAHAYGRWLTEAWNPYMPMLWWVVFLLAVWSVLCDDLPLLPVAVFAGSFCAQTHIPYAGLIVGLGGLLTLVLAYRYVLRRGDRAGDPADDDAGTADAPVPETPRSPDRRTVGRWVLASTGLLVLLWLPPVIDQVVHDRGNLELIYENFTREGNEEVGFRTAAETLTVNLSVENLWQDHGDDDQAAVDGGIANPYALALLAVAAGTAVLAWRRGYRDLLQLHALLGAALLLGLVAVSRIFDTMWYYLVLWSWGLMVLLLLAAGWTVVRTVGEVLAARDASHADGDGDGAALTPRLARAGAIALVVALVAVGGKFSYDAAFYEPPAMEETEILAEVTPDLVRALRSGDLPGGGGDGRYRLHWGSDALAIGSQGFGLLLELERQGLDVGVVESMATGAVPHRVLPVAEATAQVEYVVGERFIECWRDRPDAAEALVFEPRDREERAEFDRLHDEAVEELEAEGLDHLVTLLDENLFRTGIHPETPPEVGRKVTRMMDLGLPVGVFVVPPGAECLGGAAP
ncbi:MAG TPA: hypothetical protein VIL36_10535 [Acidimicrobiales bacterium]